MEKNELPAVVLQELGQQFVAVVRRAMPDLVGRDLDGIEQGVQTLGRRLLGKVVEQVITLMATQETAAPPACPGCHVGMRLVDGVRLRHLHGLVGDYTVRRAYYACDGCHQTAAPLDARLGLGPGALSPGLARVACRVGMEKPFGASADVLAEVLGVTLSAEAVRRITEGMGVVAEADQQRSIARAQTGQAPQAASDGTVPPAVLAVEVDGAMVRLLDGWHEVKVGLAAPLGPASTTDPDTGRVRLELGPPVCCAGMEPAEPFWYRVYVQACLLGLLGRGLRTVVVLGDGADWIWRHAHAMLAVGGVELVAIVDIYHAWSHLAAVAEALFGAGTPQAHAWLAPCRLALRDHGAPIILRTLRALLEPSEEPAAALALLPAPPDPLSPATAEVVRQELGYFTTHAARMDYPCFVARQFPIGSGAVESRCKSLIQARVKGAGMRWSRPGVQAVASLRALHHSGRWQPFWQTHPLRRRTAPPCTVPSPPVPDAQHDKQAA